MYMPSIFGESLFDTFFDELRPMRRASQEPRRMPLMRTDVKESDTGFELAVDLPGYKKEDIKAQLKDGYLTVSAEMNGSSDEKDENGKYIRRERYAGSCSRSFYVGEELKQEDIKAKFENGTLTLAIPKKQPEPEIPENYMIAIEG